MLVEKNIGSSDYDLMPFETPLLRVSRPVAACSRCRAAKVRCDGKLPACTACERSNRASECSSTNDQFARGKERSYVATLESRVEALERRILDAQARRRSSVPMLDDGMTPPRRPSLAINGSGSRPSSTRAIRKKEASDMDSLVSDFGLLSVNATARDFYGFTSAMSYARLVLCACTKDSLPEGLNKALPPRYSASPLIQHYLNHIFIILPLCDEASIYASVDAVYNPDPRKATAFDHWTVRMILAIASVSVSNQRGDSSYLDGIGHVSAALQHAEDVLHPGSIPSIQAVLLLVEYAMFDPHHFDSWTLIGVASRAMVDLGIHQDPSKASTTSKVKLELRRKVYYCVYALDRSTAISGRTPWKDPYSRIWRIYQEMTDWFSKLTPVILPEKRTFFELDLLYSYVYILSPSPRCPRISEYAQRLMFEHCTAYATTLLNTISDTSGKWRPSFTYYDAMRAYMTGRQFVDILSRNQDALLTTSPPRLSSNTAPADDIEVDPLEPSSPGAPPPFPQADPNSVFSADPTTRAINAINDFTSILSRFGVRFGYMNWLNRFKRESAGLLAQLYARSQQNEMDLGYCIWNGSPTIQQPSYSLPDLQATATQTAFPNPSPARRIYTNDPAFSQPMPDTSLSSQWAGMGAHASSTYEYTTAESMAMPATVSFAPAIGDHDSALAWAWETLPGGSRNARFT
ncbi:hypothetical protein H2199_003501 [Coniosporium tulheliwenetii]|uniref:Uncharacterized protein n=1 Tax=Coniosporium tulheliwenetii TaxID=3383036 RepID=A0ACC2ZB67_9PEZI|nr:hypothetical protein H2199_003501 [Cladosporium sp. JES 115]